MVPTIYFLPVQLLSLVCVIAATGHVYRRTLAHSPNPPFAAHPYVAAFAVWLVASVLRGIVSGGATLLCEGREICARASDAIGLVPLWQILLLHELALIFFVFVTYTALFAWKKPFARGNVVPAAKITLFGTAGVMLALFFLEVFIFPTVPDFMEFLR